MCPFATETQTTLPTKVPSRWVLWLQWTLACTVSGGLMGLTLEVQWPLLVTGVAFAVPQWLLLRSRIPRASRWLVVTSMGAWLAMPVGPFTVLAVGLMLPPATLHIVSPFLIFLVTGVVGGFAVGVAQWLVLRQHAAGAVLWIYTSAAAGVLFMPTQALLMLSAEVSHMGLWGMFLCMSAGYGVWTGWVLSSLLQDTRQSNPQRT